MKYLYTNIISSFVLDEKLKIIDEGKESALKKKHKTEPLPQDKLPQILLLFKDKKYYQEFYQKNLQLTKQSIKQSVNEDQLIIQAISNINELDRINNMLAKRLREWYSLYLPELSQQISNHEQFAYLVANKNKGQLMKEIKVEETMGSELESAHVDEMVILAKQILNNYQLRKKHEEYLRNVMKIYCPNFLELAGVTIGAKLIEMGKSLKHLAMLPASTIQLLGAEKALFRHIKSGSKSPKYGLIVNHPLVQQAKDKKGKAARMLADKLSLCARLDYFKGEFKAKEMFKELEAKLK